MFYSVFAIPFHFQSQRTSLRQVQITLFLNWTTYNVHRI